MGFASSPRVTKTAPNTEVDTNIGAANQGAVISTPAPEENSLVRVYRDGFYYDMPADGWDTYGPYVLESARGTGSRIEMSRINFYDSEVADLERLGYTKIEETGGLTVLAQTEVLEYMDGSVFTIRREVYVYGWVGQMEYSGLVELMWTEENLTEETANEPEIMRAIARSFTVLAMIWTVR